MAYETRNILIGAAAIFLSAQDSTTWTSAPNLPSGATFSGKSIVNGQAFGAAGAPTATSLMGATTDWRHVGFTSEGLELSYEPDYGDVAVDQLLDSAKVFKQGQRVTVNTTFTEASLKNLLVVWGQAERSYTTSGGEETVGIAAGALGDEPTERALVAVGPGPRTLDTGKQRERVYYARRVLSVESSSQALRRSEATVFPVSFRLLPDPNAALDQEYGLIRDRVITA